MNFTVFKTNVDPVTLVDEDEDESLSSERAPAAEQQHGSAANSVGRRSSRGSSG